jgi:proline iminopeptidase
MVTALVVGCAQPQPPDQQPEPPEGLENGSFAANLNGFDIHYEVHGQGPVLMVVTNSWGFTAAGLRTLFQPLEERLTMVYFDPRGMGQSAPIQEESDMGMAAVRADFDALRQHLGLDTVNAIGWSNGAMNLILLAAECPDTIDSAIFLHGAASFTEEDMQEFATDYPEMMQSWMSFQEEMKNPDLSDEERLARMLTLWLEEWFPASSADPEWGRENFKQIFRPEWFSYQHADYANRESPTFDARDQLSPITARCLVLAGAHDTMSPDKVREMHDGLGDSIFQLFEASGHFAPLEEPEAFKAAVFGFLEVE